jgi:Recombinase
MVPAEQVAAERAVIAERCQRILGGELLPSVVRDLDRHGLATVNGNRWTRNGLRQMLDRPALAGLLTYNGTVVGRLAGAEPIIKAEEWERLSAILAGPVAVR